MKYYNVNVIIGEEIRMIDIFSSTRRFVNYDSLIVSLILAEEHLILNILLYCSTSAVSIHSYCRYAALPINRCTGVRSWCMGVMRELRVCFFLVSVHARLCGTGVFFLFFYLILHEYMTID